MARSTIDRSDCRLVMSPATCGSGARSAKAAPPLKSTSTKASCSGGWVAARPATIVRNSSLLPEPGGTDDQAVWADTALGRLLEVQDERLPGQADADRHLEELVPGTRRQPATGPARVTWPGRRAGRGGERARLAKPSAAGGRAGGAPGAGRWSRSGEACRVGADAGDPATARDGLQERREPLVVEADAHRQLGRLVGGGRGQPDDRHAGRRDTGRGDSAAATPGVGDRTRFGRVEDRQQVRAGAGRAWSSASRERGWPGGRGVASGWVAGVREPSHPLPGRAGGGWVGGEDLEVVGGVEGGELADQGAGEGACPGRWAGEGQDGELAEGNGHRGVGEPGCSADEVLRRLQELGVVLGEWAAGGVEPGRGGEGDGAAADPHREEVGVAGAALPEPVGLVDRRPEGRQVGVEVLGDGELGGGQLVGLDRDLLEVGEVAGPFAAPGPAGGAALDQAEHEARHHRGDGGPDHQGDQPRRPGAGDGEQERDRPTAADQRHQVLQPAGEAGGGPADRRRGRHRQLDRRQRRAGRPAPADAPGTRWQGLSRSP